MGYTNDIIARVRKLERTGRPGVMLGLWAIYRNVPVAQISAATGATRQTVYNWMLGGNVTRSYEERVDRVTAILEKAKTGEEAWATMCREFNLRS